VPTEPRSRRVLLTVSGVIPDDVRRQVALGLRPRPDYVELARAIGADLLDVVEARRRTGRLGRLVERLGGAGPLLALACFRARRHYDVVLTDGEQVGLPLALLASFGRRRGAHVMIVHVLSARKKVLVYRLLRLGRRIDRMLVYSSFQQRFITEQLGFPADRVTLTPFMVDTRFFAADQVEAAAEPMVCSAGLEHRDYRTLIDAVRGLDVRVVLAAASPWSKHADSSAGANLPPNVEVCRLGFADLRQLYADAAVVVMPLHDVEFQAGVTTILEAMSMGKAVICSRTAGQTDVIVDQQNGIYVPPGDAPALRAAIVALLDEPDRAASLGAAARRRVESDCEVRVYAERLAGVVERAAALVGPGLAPLEAR
jgi:glycosyltransferase involved in cell wall biosynthesis